ncbi:hypothetical protein OAD02_00565 [Alphaproteobacteria bacterium]|nr:hypothetical protein [Alphaproteobacteria bacterium]
MKKLFVIITILFLSGCHVTGHNTMNIDKSIMLGSILGALL